MLDRFLEEKFIKKRGRCSVSINKKPSGKQSMYMKLVGQEEILLFWELAGELRNFEMI